MNSPTITKITVEPGNGLDRTLKELYALESVSLRIPSFVDFVRREFSGNCIPCIPGKIWKYVIENFKYVSDAPFDEIIRAPHVLLYQKEGDCDDFSLFIKTCLDLAGGYNSKYMLLGTHKNNFSHILVFANRGIENGKYIDPLYIDGANKTFNQLPTKYKFYKLIG